MKVRISDNLKGEVRIEGFSRTFKAGHTFDISEDLFYSSHNQWAVSVGYLIPVDKLIKKITGAKAYQIQCMNKNPVTLPIIGRALFPKEKFFVNEDQFKDSKLQHAISAGIFKVLPESKKEISLEAIAIVKKEIVIKENVIEEGINKPLTKKKSSTRKKAPKNKSVRKKVSKGKNSSKKVRNKIIIKSGVKEDVKTNTNMTVCRPKGGKVNEPPKMANKEEVHFVEAPEEKEFGDMFIDNDNSPEKLKMVDMEQELEKLSQATNDKFKSKKRTNKTNNEEVK